MPEKPKAGGRARESRQKAEEKPQAERFVETARQIGADETGEAFERAFRKIVPPKRNTTER